MEQGYSYEEVRRQIGPTAVGAGIFGRRSTLNRRRVTTINYYGNLKEEGVGCGRTPEGRYVTNVRRRHACHSRVGFAWGYYGWESLELALNILSELFPGEEVALLDETYTSKKAWDLHFDFCHHFLQNMAVAGRIIPLREVERWVELHIEKKGYV